MKLEKRTKTVQARLSEKEFIMLNAKLAKTGLNASLYCRLLILNDLKNDF
jgi:hypothetical protein